MRKTRNWLLFVGLLVVAGCDKEGTTLPTPSSTTGETETTATEETELPVSQEPPVEVTTESTGVSGTFSYATNYGTPKGETEMTVSFTVQEGVISAFSLQGNPQHKTSREYQVLYEGKAGDFVIGKNISEIQDLPSVVNGSSLTSTGFNDALSQLRVEA